MREQQPRYVGRSEWLKVQPDGTLPNASPQAVLLLATCILMVLLVATVFLEGMLHAALHLQKIRHAQSLAIGASPAQQAATGPDTDGSSATPFIRLIEVAQHYDAPGPDVAIASNRGRSPPTSPT